MIQVFKRHIYLLLIISILLNLTGGFLVVRKLYYKRLHTKLKEEREKYLNYTYQRSSVLKWDSIPSDKVILRSAILNTLVDKFNYNSYLEIGQGYADNNLNRIKCKIKIGVDPDSNCKATYRLTSDEFFAQNKATFDLIYVDGLHRKDQVYKDIINSLKCLNENGTIVVHDCNPINEKMQSEQITDDEWTGDVWKAWVKLRSERDDLEMFVVPVETGCGIIRAGKQKTIKMPDRLTYQYLSENRKYLLNMISVNDFLSYVKITVAQ